MEQFVPTVQTLGNASPRTSSALFKIIHCPLFVRHPTPIVEALPHMPLMLYFAYGPNCRCWKWDCSCVPPYNFRTNAPAPLENFAHLEKSTFSTVSALSRHSRRGLESPLLTAKRTSADPFTAAHNSELSSLRRVVAAWRAAANRVDNRHYVSSIVWIIRQSPCPHAPSASAGR
jgi:hypothetical protein